jgi:uncharacterized protein (DUF58 family)
MWLRTIFRRRPDDIATPQTALDERLLRRLERLTLTASRDLRGGLSGVHPSRRFLPGPTFTDHRPYTVGDDLRYVDWNAYARLDHLQVKLGETEQDIRVHLLLDCSASMDWGQGDLNKLHYARLLAAAIGYVALASGDRLHVLPFGAPRPTMWGPGGGRQRIGNLMQYLGGLEASGTTTSIERLRQLRQETRGGLLVVVSDLLHSADLLEGTAAALAPFHPPRWQVLLLHLLHPQELEPDLQSDVELVDSESGGRLPLLADDAAMNRYADAVDGWCARMAQASARRNIIYVRLTSDMSLERAALPYLQLREALR